MKALAEQAHQTAPKTGVLLVNLGTPDAPTAAAIRRYLRQFLSDPRVVELPRALWLPILYGFILPLRPRRLARAYATIWNEQGSPLLAISQRQTERLRQALTTRLGCELPVALAMSYGNPSIEQGLHELEQQGVRRLLLLPLYPQFSGTTTASVLDAVLAAFGRRRWPPELRTVNQYHDHSGYIAALAQSVSDHWSANGRSDYLLVSFHGIPQTYVQAGDPYFCQCHKTARLLAEALALEPGRWSVAFQSRLGKAPWVQPYTDFELPRLAGAGIGTLDVICPGFAADCLETLEEVAQRYRADFIRAGGRELRYIPALNDSAAHIEALSDLVEAHLRGWMFEPENEATRQLRMQRAASQQQFFV
jgi:ferrochelatase